MGDSLERGKSAGGDKKEAERWVLERRIVGRKKKTI